MEINSNRNVDPALPVGAPFKARPASAAASDTSFEQSAGLNAELDATPDSRAALVERAQRMVAQSSYPPPETIKRIANLLAANLSVEA